MRKPDYTRRPVISQSAAEDTLRLRCHPIPKRGGVGGGGSPPTKANDAKRNAGGLKMNNRRYDTSLRNIAI